MKFHTYTMTNFGSYRGRNPFDFQASTAERPIILIGGRNGSGKTTFFEGIKCCLFGKRSRGHKIRQIDYEQYLIDRRSNSMVDDEISELELTFEIVNHGKLENYLVRRKWWLNDHGKIIEDFLVERNGVWLREIPKNNWQNYIFGLLPPQVLDLFFFDSEDLKDLEITGEEGDYLNQILVKLFGLEYIDQLVKDLDIQLSDLAENREKNTKNEITKSYERKSQIIINMETLTERKGEVKNLIRIKNSSLETIEAKLSNLGGDFAKSRNRNLEQKIKLETTIIQLENLLAREMGKLLPFIIVKDRIKTLVEETNTEDQVKDELVFKELLFNKLEKNTELDKMLSPNDKNWKEIILKNLIDEDTIMQGLTYDLSANESLRLQNYFRELKNNNHLYSYFTPISKLKHYREELSEIEDNIARAPKEENIQLVLEEIKQTIGEIHNLEKEYSEIKQEIDVLSGEMKRIERDLEVLRKKIKVSDKQIQNRIDKTQEILKDYRVKILERKCEILEERILSNFKLICSKGKLTSRITIDPNTFQIVLYDTNNNLWKKNFLSEGEKQLFAISILWALVQLTERNYPFIIDTPLGRLDKEHRDGLVSEFFGKATEQMIILSTNEEIDNLLYKKLKKHIAQSYLLRYDEKLMESTVSVNQYFHKELIV